MTWSAGFTLTLWCYQDVNHLPRRNLLAFINAHPHFLTRNLVQVLCRSAGDSLLVFHRLNQLHCESITVVINISEHEPSWSLEHVLVLLLTVLRTKVCCVGCPQRVLRVVYSNTEWMDIQNLCLAEEHMFFKVRLQIQLSVKSDDSGCKSAALPVVPVTSSGLFTWLTSCICFPTQGGSLSQHYRSERKTGNVNLAQILRKF